MLALSAGPSGVGVPLRGFVLCGLPSASEPVSTAVSCSSWVSRGVGDHLGRGSKDDGSEVHHARSQPCYKTGQPATSWLGTRKGNSAKTTPLTFARSRKEKQAKARQKPSSSCSEPGPFREGSRFSLRLIRERRIEPRRLSSSDQPVKSGPPSRHHEVFRPRCRSA